MTRVLVEVLDGHGRLRTRERLTLAAGQARFTVGRGIDADVIIDDPHAAALHAAVDITPEGGVLVTDLGSLNGIVVGHRREHRARALALADGYFGIGRTRLRVRTAAETLAAELPEDGAAWAGLHDPRNARTLTWLAFAGLLFFLLFVGYTSWLSAPRDAAVDIATALVSALLLAGAWVAAWGFVTRVMLGEWRWLVHGAIFFSAFAVLAVVDWAIDVLWFALALPSWVLSGEILLMIFAACVLHHHLRGASNIGARRAAFIALLLPAAIGGSSWLVMNRNQARDVDHIASETQLFPPDWRVREAAPLDDYFEVAAGLKEQADDKRRDMSGDESDSE